MLQEVFMPKLGDTVEEATIEAWHKKEGDQVQKGEVLLEVTTDKATLEVESLVSGTLRKIIVEPGHEVPVGQVIAYVGDKDDPLPADIGQQKPAEAKAGPAAPAAPSKPAPAPAAPEAPVVPAAGAVVPEPAGRIFASPRAKRRAREEQIPLQLLTGTGPNGRIVEADVERYAEQLAPLSVTPTAKELACQKGVDLTKVSASGDGGKITKEDVLAALRGAPAAPVSTGREPLSAMRRVVAERMTLSKTTIPHYYLTIEVDMTAAMAFRSMVSKTVGVKFSYNDLLAKVCALAIRQVPMINAFWDDGAIGHRSGIHIGYAVALDSGLMVPVVRDVDKKALAQIAETSAQLIDKARGKRLTPDEYGNGSITISNLGMMGVDNFVPVINPGESVILGVGRIADRVVVKDGGLHVRKMMNITMSGDHRVVDGAVGAQFLSIVKALLEDPEQIQ